MQGLEGFTKIDSISRNLLVQNNLNLQSIQGFSSLEYVGGDFYLTENSALNQLHAFHALGFVGNDFLIRNNHFSELLAFTLLQRIGAVFSIRNEDHLITLGSFARLQSVGDNFVISENELLKEIGGFNQLAFVGDNLQIEFNASLKHIAGFGQLQSVVDHIWIRNNVALAHVKGFGQLSVVGGDLRIADNDILASIFAFVALQSVDELEVSNNPNLFYCCGLSNVLQLMGYNSLVLAGNAPGCNSSIEILSLCDATLSDCNPNCVGQLNVALDRSGVAIISPSDFILDTMECSSGLEISVENKWGGTIFGPQLMGINAAFPIKACRYLHQQPLKLVARSSTGTCWSDLTFKKYEAPTIPSEPITTVLCTDPLVKGPLPGTSRPAWIPCQPEQEATYVTDWITVVECEPGVNDTVKIIYREWEAFGKDGARGVSLLIPL